jgi:hypothetical protein
MLRNQRFIRAGFLVSHNSSEPELWDTNPNVIIK